MFCLLKVLPVCCRIAQIIKQTEICVVWHLEILNRIVMYLSEMLNSLLMTLVRFRFSVISFYLDGIRFLPSYEAIHFKDFVIGWDHYHTSNRCIHVT